MQRLGAIVWVAAVSALFLGAPVLAAPPPQAADGLAHQPACPSAPAGFARCFSEVVTDGNGQPATSTVPTGLSPAAIQSAYAFPTASGAGAGETVAIVDAYDDPTAANDLAVFSTQYGLPACAAANGCFTKVSQTGTTRYPRTNSAWAVEISLDIEWVHAVAPGAHILLVEASSNSFSNLMAAEDYAKARAPYVTNSWGGSESPGETANDAHFVASGVSFFVSSGDNGLPAEYPSASPNVISVGGTTLHFDSAGNFAGETGWSGSGGGCSTVETADPSQSAFAQYSQAGCGGKRATPDVALDADPGSGVSVYDSTPNQGVTGWLTVGGTSASSPMWAARSADAGAVVNAGYIYGPALSYRDITFGNNGASALTGYDLVTGRGSRVG